MINGIIKRLQKHTARWNVFNSLETGYLKESSPDLPPIFIIGPPRSGSTLLYQLLVAQYGFGYFSNLSNFFYKAPVIISRIVKLCGFHYKARKLVSKFGLIYGLTSPSESGSIFRYWFDELPWNDETRARIRMSINNRAKISNSSFIVKNLYNNFRINKLIEIFPDALFIIIRRDLKYVAQSLLLARKDEKGTYENWFGLKPMNYNEISEIKDPFLQVYYQVNSINVSINDSIKKSNPNYIEINYNALCNNTLEELKRIAESYCDYYGIKLLAKDIVVNNIQNQNVKKLEDSDWEKLNKLYS